LSDRLSQHFDVTIDLFFGSSFGHGHKKHVLEVTLD